MAEDEPADGDAHRTWKEAHPASTLSLVAELRRNRWTLRLRFGSLQYIEVIKSTTLSVETPLVAGLEGGARW